MTTLYRGHPNKDPFDTDEQRGLSCTELLDVAKNYALDYARGGNGTSYLTTITFLGSITLSDQRYFRGPDSFKAIVNGYRRDSHSAVKTGCGTLVVVFDFSKIQIIKTEEICLT